MIHIIGPKRDGKTYLVPENMVNTTSRSYNWSRGLSPFYLGPVYLYDFHTANNVENAWQFCKVYPEHVDVDNNPTEKYWEWAKIGWTDKYAHRYPMGKGAKPLYSLWKGQKLTYVEARKAIYIPLYRDAVKDTDAFKQLQQMYKENKDLYLWDFDGYNHRSLDMSYKDVVNHPVLKMGHAFVLAMMLEEQLEEIIKI
jgi:hypothetical protein